LKIRHAEPDVVRDLSPVAHGDECSPEEGMRCAVLSSRPELAPGNVSGVFEFVVGVVGN
jgi:hypothetical protein